MRVLAPLGRRRVALTGADDVGAYRVMRVADLDAPVPQAGQFYMLAAAEGWGAGDDERPYLPRAFSFLYAGAGELSFMLEDVGPGTHRLAQLEEGDELWLTGPLGLGFRAPHDGRRALLAGGGVGVPPLSAWARELSLDGEATVTVVLGFRDAHHAAGAALMADGDIIVATDDGSVGHHGLVTELLAAALDDDDHAVVYACGPPGMLEAVRALCAARGVPAQLALEAGMACGFGACYGCAVKVDGRWKRLCVEGPVLEASRAVA